MPPTGALLAQESRIANHGMNRRLFFYKEGRATKKVLWRVPFDTNGTTVKLKFNFFVNVRDELINFNAFLLHRIAIANRDTSVCFTIKIIG